ncbi:MAG TPA: transglycosylase SLT domain-containing protein [Pyrinomonadaceae bacterium]|nr:transglycosylase SLT domain-containing protein [Pyrinomonadaceae bacterium]
MSFARVVLIFVLTTVAALKIVAQPERITAAVEAADWQTARAEINKLRSSNETLFRDKNYDYLLGRIAERTGDLAAATASYQTIAANNSLIREYALWRLAKFARATGDLVLERERLQQLVATAPSSLLFEAATLRLSESFFESGDFQGAANSAKPLTLSKNVNIAREGGAFMAAALARAGKVAEARDAYSRLVMQMPDASRPDDFALEAVRQLDAFDNNSPNLSEADHLLRASVYQFNRDFAGARVHYQAVIDRYPQSTTVPNAMFQIARGLYNEAKYDDAAKLFQKVFDSYPQSTSARDALGFLGSTYVRMKRVDDAVAAYKLLIDRFPDAPNPERPYLNIIDSLHEAGRYTEALNWVQQTRARFKNDLGGALALFAQLRIHMAQGSWSTVVRDADELLKLADLGGTRVGGGTTTAEVNFLRAYALEQLGRTEEAIAGYLSIPDGRNEYYGQRATQRLLALAANQKSRTLVRNRLNALLGESKAAGAAGQYEQSRAAAQAALRLTDDVQIRSDGLKQVQAAYNALSTYRLPQFNRISLLKQQPPNGDHEALADNLLLLGLYDEALPELLAARGANKGSPDEDYTIALLSLRAGIPNRAVRFAEQTWKPVPADYLLELAPRELVELLYPVPFRESLLQNGNAAVDPRFVLSIARQESRFQADAKSVAAARGMMQFIASTANDIAAQLKLQNFQQDDLYNPDTSIRFGSQYLANLFQQFPNQPQAVAGSYNGGADNLARWIARSHANEADRYVPEIGFSQTKDYVYKVLANFWNYQRLYDAKLQPK